MPPDPTLLGTVQDVTGATIRGVLGANTVSGLAFIEGHGYRLGQVGSFIRIPLGYLDLFGIVSQVGAGSVPAALVEHLPHGDRWITVEIIGEAHRDQAFQRGISQYPNVGDPVHLVTRNDLARVYGRPESARYVQVGHLASADSIPALIDIDRLVTRHSAVVGTTGAGKSTTVASLLTALTDPKRLPSSRVMIIDLHGEYAAALRDRATVFRVGAPGTGNQRPLHVPYWAMSFDELMSVTCGPLDDQARGALADRLLAAKRNALTRTPREGVTADSLTVDSPVPFSIHQLWFDLFTETRATHYERPGVPQSKDTWALELDAAGTPLQEGNPLEAIPPRFRAIKNVANDPEKIRLSQSPLNIGRPLERMGSRLRDPRFWFLYRPGPWLPGVPDTSPAEDLDTLLKAWIAGPTPITILDVSGIPPSVLTDLIGVVLRIVYDALFWGRSLPEGGRQRPLLLVLEEAHTYLSPGGGGVAADAVRRIVKEGRKYGIGAMIVSQRPSEIDETVLSQCGTMVAMRLANSPDRSRVVSAVSDNLEGLLSMLPVLRTGEAVVVGESVNLPMRIVLGRPPKDRRPDSDDPRVFDEAGKTGWTKPREDPDLRTVVKSWRSQTAAPGTPEERTP